MTNKDKVLERWPDAVCEEWEVEKNGFGGLDVISYAITRDVEGETIVLAIAPTEFCAWDCAAEKAVEEIG